jgi:hypothetical protein
MRHRLISFCGAKYRPIIPPTDAPRIAQITPPIASKQRTACIPNTSNTYTLQGATSAVPTDGFRMYLGTSPTIRPNGMTTTNRNQLNVNQNPSSSHLQILPMTELHEQAKKTDELLQSLSSSTKWEYHRLFINHTENFPDKLASVGERGWELVAVWPIGDLTAWFIFKKPTAH